MRPTPRPALPKPEGVVSHPLARALLAFGLLYVFLVGVNGLGGGFESLGDDVLNTFFRATANPFLGLVIGLLATALVQSSSVTTSLIVGLVAAPENPLPVANAVPMIMGANIGTTVTNTIVSLAHVGRSDEFRRAFAVATCHDFFNFGTVIILLPLEMLTGYLQHSAEILTRWLPGLGGVEYESPLKSLITAGVTPLRRVTAALTDSEQIRALLLILACGTLIYTSLLALVKTMRSLLRRRMDGAISAALDRNPLVAMLIGMITTVLVQSSSITTSLLVPLAGAGLITLAQAFPVTIGANVGTTITALLASLAATGANAAAGLTIALVHLLFNVSGGVIIYPVKRIRAIPLAAARKLADVAAANRWVALGYVAVLFYLLPMTLAVLYR